MKKSLILLLILLAFPMTKFQMIRTIRCQNPQYTYEELIRLPSSTLAAMIQP